VLDGHQPDLASGVNDSLRSNAMDALQPRKRYYPNFTS
jgi:hypothetical protein